MCRPACLTNTDCTTDEFCDVKEMKCVKACQDYMCGLNSICTVSDHISYCSCQEGYFPQARIGCREKEVNDTVPSEESQLDCGKYCGTGSKCKLRDFYIQCYCDEVVGVPFFSCNKPSVANFDTEGPGVTALSDAIVQGMRSE